jgi:hypothetical protein
MSAVLGLLYAVSALAADPTRFSVESRNLSVDDLNAPYLNMAVQWESGTDTKPESLKKAPPNLPDNAQFFQVQLGNRSTVMLVVPGKLPKLYVDADMDSDLSDEKPITGKRLRSGTMGWDNGYEFAAVPVPSSQPSEATKNKPGIQVILLNNDYLVVAPKSYLSGTIEVKGKKYRVRLVDANYDGRYDGVMQFGRRSKSTKGKDKNPPPAYDSLAIDLNGDGKFAWAYDGSAEVMPLPKMLRFGEDYYAVRFDPNGSSVSIEKASPRFGTLDVGQPDVELLLWSETGVHQLKGSGGKWQLPEGEYSCYMIYLNRTDQKKNKFTLACRGDTGNLKDFEVAEGKTTSFKLGPPLTTKAKVTLTREMFRRTARISASVMGQEDEEYLAGVRKNGELVPAPSIKILDSNAKVVESGKLEYG